MHKMYAYTECTNTNIYVIHTFINTHLHTTVHACVQCRAWLLITCLHQYINTYAYMHTYMGEYTAVYIRAYLPIYIYTQILWHKGTIIVHACIHTKYIHNNYNIDRVDLVATIDILRCIGYLWGLSSTRANECTTVIIALNEKNKTKFNGLSFPTFKMLFWLRSYPGHGK